MSSQRPGSLSLTKTPAVMCIAETSTMPSCTPLFFTKASTVSVMRTSSRFFFVSNHRYSVPDFMGFSLPATISGVQGWSLLKGATHKHEDFDHRGVHGGSDGH